MTRTRAIAAIAVMTIGVSACAPGEVAGIVDDLPTQDLTQSDDPTLRAAGQTPLEILSAREAEDNLARGLAETDLNAVRQASRLRPADPRYVGFEAAVLESKSEEEEEAVGRLRTLIADQHPDATPTERVRIGQEAYLNALREVIRSNPAFDGREEKIGEYCKAINTTYSSYNLDEFPSEVAFYLAVEADFSLCS